MEMDENKMWRQKTVNTYTINTLSLHHFGFLFSFAIYIFETLFET